MVLVSFANESLDELAIDKEHGIVVDHDTKGKGSFFGEDSLIYDDALMVHPQGITFKELQALQLDGIREIGHECCL